VLAACLLDFPAPVVSVTDTENFEDKRQITRLHIYDNFAIVHTKNVSEQGACILQASFASCISGKQTQIQV